MDKTSSFENSCDNVSQDPGAVNAQAGQGKRQLVKAAGIVGGMTLASRILGMVRDIVSAKAFGTTWQWDAFLYAFMLPNFFRRLVGEGALSSAFVPVYSETLSQKGKEEAFRFANIMVSILIMGFTVTLLLLESVMALVLSANVLPERLNLIIDLLRFFFPYLALMSLYALWMGVLNSHKYFLGASAGPVVINIIWIAGTVWVAGFTEVSQTIQLRWLAGIILASGLIQIGFEWPSLLQIGYRLRWIWDRSYAGVQKTFALLFPVMLGFAVMQINIMVDMTLSFWVGPGANSALWYSNRLMQFPLGIFAIGMGTALLPAISAQIASGNKQLAEKNLVFAMKSIFLIIMPCSAGLMVLAKPIVQMLFERGEFDHVSTARTGVALYCYAAGLMAFAGQKIITAGFYASHDTKTPMQIAVMALVINMVFNLILMGPMKEAGLALSTSISGIIQFLLLLGFFNRKAFKLPGEVLLKAFLKTLAASVLMYAFCAWMYPETFRYFSSSSTADQALRVFITITSGAVLYFILCCFFRIEEISEIFAVLLKKKKLPAGESRKK